MTHDDNFGAWLEHEIEQAEHALHIIQRHDLESAEHYHQKLNVLYRVKGRYEQSQTKELYPWKTE